MAKTVEVSITRDKKAAITLKGRLLGAVSIMEGTKILQNTNVSKRIATGVTVELSEALKSLEEIHKEDTLKSKNGRLVIAVNTMKDEEVMLDLSVLTRQLLLTAPIEMVTQTAKDKDGMYKATMNGVDDSLIIVEEKGAKSDD